MSIKNYTSVQSRMNTIKIYVYFHIFIHLFAYSILEPEFYMNLSHLKNELLVTAINFK